MYSTPSDKLAEEYRLAVAAAGVHANINQNINANTNINTRDNSYNRHSNCLIVSPSHRTPHRTTIIQRLSRGSAVPLEHKAVSESPNLQHTLPSSLVTQLHKSIEGFADEVATLRKRLDEEQRVCMEKDLALVELEERMTNVRVRMMEALSTYRKSNLT
ncbi:hypothetical protein LSM04_003473 [Trypanosoma melophagium]|uniref:uncharacterized protein n=1 Tax=Trypanosoma melophagium TaxID=715481 RepID=UPI00351A3299|nr:hypothetical protein LSM04_003473 [Trypanosoma melophagium]